jgi:hypothetical protein
MAIALIKPLWETINMVVISIGNNCIFSTKALPRLMTDSIGSTLFVLASWPSEFITDQSIVCLGLPSSSPLYLSRRSQSYSISLFVFSAIIFAVCAARPKSDEIIMSICLSSILSATIFAWFTPNGVRGESCQPKTTPCRLYSGQSCKDRRLLWVGRPKLWCILGDR